MKHRYKVRVQTADGVEETQFIPQGAAPRVRTRYVRDPKEHGKYKDGREYSVDPEKLDAEAEEAEPLAESPQAEEQREQEKVAEKVVRKSRKKGGE